VATGAPPRTQLGSSQDSHLAGLGDGRGKGKEGKEGKVKGIGGVVTERRGKGWEGRKRAKDERGGKKRGVAPTAPTQPVQPRGLLGAADMTVTSRGVQM